MAVYNIYIFFFQRTTQNLMFSIQTNLYTPLLQSSVSHDPPEIILILCFRNISIENSYAMWLKIQLMHHSLNIHIIQYFIIQDVMELKSSG